MVPVRDMMGIDYLFICDIARERLTGFASIDENNLEAISELLPTVSGDS